MGIRFGTSYKNKLDMSGAANTANSLLGMGRNKLNTANSQTLGPWQENPVGNLMRGVQPGSDPVRQVVGTGATNRMVGLLP